MALYHMLLFPALNEHEFMSSQVKRQFRPKILDFQDLYLSPYPNILFLIFGLFLFELGYSVMFCLVRFHGRETRPERIRFFAI